MTNPNSRITASSLAEFDISAHKFGSFALLFILLAAKAPDALTNAQFWAEDGTIFFQQQFGHSLPQIFVPYAGYLHAIPRIVAFLARMVPYAETPLFYNLAALLIATGSVFFFCSKTRFLAPAWVVASIFILTPTNGEEFGSITNIQWFLQFALFSSIFLCGEDQPVKRKSVRLIWDIAILLMALTGPFSILCVVLCGWILLEQYVAKQINHDKKSFLWLSLNKRAMALTSIGAAFQLYFLVFDAPRVTSGTFSISIAKELLLLGPQEHTFGTILVPANLTLAALALVGILLLKDYIAGSNRIVASCMALLFFGILQLIPVSNENARAVVSGLTLNGDRYYFFLKVAVCITAAAALKSSRRYVFEGGAMVIPLVLLFFALDNPGSLRRPVLADMHWKEQARLLNHSNVQRQIPINPNWYITISPQE